jgi:hypothetical protein
MASPPESFCGQALPEPREVDTSGPTLQRGTQAAVNPSRQCWNLCLFHHGGGQALDPAGALPSWSVRATGE